MIPLIEQHRDALAALCRRYGVKRLDVFGTVVRGDFGPARSDIDFSYGFDATDFHPLADRYFAFIEAAERLLGQKVDIVRTSRTATSLRPRTGIV